MFSFSLVWDFVLYFFGCFYDSISYYAPPVGKGIISVVFVRPSVRLCVCPSVAYIANNSKTQRPSVPKFGRRFPTLDATREPVSRSIIRVTRPINADTHRAPAISSECQGLQTSNLVYGWRMTIRISRRRPDLHGQRSRSQGHVISLSRVGPMAHKSKTNSRNITKISRRVPMTRATLRTSFKVKRSKVRITGRLMQTHKMCNISGTVRPKNFKVVCVWRTQTRMSGKRHDLQG